MPRNKGTLVPLNIIDNLTLGFYFTIFKGYLVGKPKFSFNFKGNI